MEKIFSGIFVVVGFISGAFGLLFHLSNEVAKERLRGNAPMPIGLNLDPLILDPDWLIHLLFGGCLFFLVIAVIIDGWRGKKIAPF